MKHFHPQTGLERLCKLFDKSRQAFYDHLWRTSDDQLEEALIIGLVREKRAVLPRIGGLKLHFLLKDDLKSHNILLGRDRFFSLLRSHNLLVRNKRQYVRTTMSNHHYKKWPDLIKGLEITGIEQLWVSDITYIRTQDGFVYLSLVTDAYSRKIVGYHLSLHLKARGCLIALSKAISSLSKPPATLIHHSDRGIQYCCEPYVSLLQQYNIVISMTQSGSPYDNAMAERVNGILKAELDLNRIFKGYSEAVAIVHQAIDLYNRIRPHLSLGNLTPEQAHTTTDTFNKKWKSKTYRKVKTVLL